MQQERKQKKVPDASEKFINMHKATRQTWYVITSVIMHTKDPNKS